MSNDIEKLEAGHVIIIDRFDLPNVGETVKSTWMVYLGRDSITQSPISIHLHRLTSQIGHYGASGTRSRELTVFFARGQFGIFDEDSILDFNERGYHIPRERFETYNIIPRGKLPEDVLRRIWNCVSRSKFYTRIQLVSIRESLNRAGITNLK